MAKSASKHKKIANKKIIKKVPHFKTALITGAASYLGASLAEKLIKRGWRVVGIDKTASGLKGYLKLFEGSPRFHFFKADASLGPPPNIKSVDAVFHLYQHAPHLSDGGKSSLENLWDTAESAKHILDFAAKTEAALLMGLSLQTGNSDPFSRGQEFIETLTRQYCQEKGINARLVCLPHYYGKYFLKESPSHPLAQFVKEALRGDALTIKGSGLDRDYYHHVDDVTSGLLKALLCEGTAGRTFSLCDTEGITSLELAYTIKAAAPQTLEVQFDAAEITDYLEQNPPDTANLEDIQWQALTPLKEGLRNLLTEETQRKAAPLPRPPASKTLSRKPLRNRPKIKLPPSIKTRPKIKIPSVKRSKRLGVGRKKAAFALLLALPFIFPPVYLGANLTLAVHRLKKAAADIPALQFDSAGENAQKAAGNFENTSQFLNKLEPLPQVFGREAYQNTKRLLLSGQYGSEALYYESRGMGTLKEAVEAALPYAAAAPPKESDLIEASAQFSKGLERYQLLLGESKRVKRDDIPKALRKYFDFFDQNREELRDAFATLFEVSKTMPELLGIVEPQNYLILLQNNQELRAGGGFIGSYAVLSLENGKTKELKTDDIYNLDGLLEEDNLGLTAPSRFQKYLGVSTIYLRDSNFSLDFSENAQRAKSLYEEAVPMEINGVVGVNLSLAQKLLEKLGPVETAEYGSINGGNVLEKAVFFAEKDYFKGSQNKKSFLSALTAALIEKFGQEPEESFREAVPLLLEALNSKEIMGYFPQNNLQQTLVKRGWDGRVAVDSETDFLMLAEENLGANKANYSIERHLRYEISETGREGKLEAKLTISYFNAAETDRWPLGTYKVYAQVLTSQGNKTFYREIKPQENYVKTISWELPPRINSQNYRLKIQKQPGMENTSISFFYRPILGGKPYSFEGYLTKDLEFAITSGWN